MLTNREEYIKNSFFSNMPDDEATELVKNISEIGNSIGFIGDNINKNQKKSDKRRHKYDVWISKEVKRNPDVINKIIEIRLIVDWAFETNANIFKYNFEQAFEAQEIWHEEMRIKYQIEMMNIPEIDEDRVIFRFSDKEHFMYLLKASDLTYEGNMMGNCVGGKNYKSKIKNKQSIILSIRDKNNISHVTIEIDVKTRTVNQKFGKSNKPPVDKYMDMIKESIFFISDYKDLKNKEVLKFLNINLITKNI